MRINTGKDDPAGLIASENLRSDITSIRRAISNTDRANQVIATADSALGQVSSLLNDIRGLVTESANAGALSDEQIAANQLQLDSSLEALNRIAQTTTFQGRRLLDGSLDFITSEGTNFSNISNLQIDQANLGATGSVSVDISVTAAATQATIDVENIPAEITANAATATLTLSSETVGAQATESTITFGSGATIDVVDANNADNTITSVVLAQGSAAIDFTAGVLTITNDFEGGTVTAGDIATQIAADAQFASADAGGDAGTAVTGPTTAEYTVDFGNGELLTVTADAAGPLSITDVTISDGADAAVISGTTLAITVDFTGSGDANRTVEEIRDIINAGTAGSTVTATATGTTDDIVVTSGASETLTQVRAGTTAESSTPTETQAGSAGTNGSETIEITQTSGNESADTRSITIIEGTPAVAGTPDVAFNGTNVEITVDTDADTALSTIVSAFNTFATDNDLGLQASVGTGFTGDGNFNGASESANVTDALSGGVAGGGGLANDIVIELAGANGSEVLSFGAGTTISELEAGIDLVSDATGVDASVSGTTLSLTSTDYGTDAFVDLGVIEDDAAVFSDARDTGTDITATVNGVSATGNGNELSINTATLDLTATLDSSFVGTASFDITGGGALFQLGPDVVSNQQARLGIGSVNTAQLGGTSGKLFSLGTGGDNELTSDNLDVSASIVEEAIDQVTSLRGRLGAFQRTTLETNKNALNDTLVNLTDAESSIRDADFAAESAALTRSQILVQSGTTVLQIANQNPQNVLALLR